MMLLLLKCFVLSNARSLTGLRPVEFAKFAHHAGARSEARERCESEQEPKQNKQAEERSKERQKLASGFGLRASAFSSARAPRTSAQRTNSGRVGTLACAGKGRRRRDRSKIQGYGLLARAKQCAPHNFKRVSYNTRATEAHNDPGRVALPSSDPSLINPRPFVEHPLNFDKPRQLRQQATKT
jgi:hypothetical protein